MIWVLSLNDVSKGYFSLWQRVVVNVNYGKYKVGDNVIIRNKLYFYYVNKKISEMKKHIIILTALFLSLQLNAQTHLQKDSLNIPVILVDGVEVQDIDSLKLDDMISVNVVKDKNILKYFYPRMGGIMCITTKSKKYLKPIQQKYFKQLEEAKKRRKKGVFLIR